MKETIIGIDLGSTNSCVSVLEAGQVVVIPNSEGRRTTPSIVGFAKDETKIGDSAKRQMAVNIDTIYTIKRLIGKKYDELSKDVIKRFPYKIVKGKNGGACVKIQDKTYTPQEISAMILQKMKKTAEEYLGKDVKKAVITVPAWFNDSERTATKEAGEIAGLEVVRIINEPTAAALAFGEDKKKSGKIAVVDLGGSTFDVSILDIGDGVFEVLSTNGDVFLGGDDIDNSLIDYLAEDFMKEYSMDLRKDNIALQRLKEAAEKAKIELSNSPQTEINIPYITSVENIPRHLVKTITKSEFERIMDPWIQKLKEPCLKAMKDSGLKTEDIDEVILVGGSTRIPKVIELVKDIFKKEPNKSVNPDEAVSVGAAIQGAILGGEITDILLIDVISLNLGIETVGGVMTNIIEANTSIPITKSETFTTYSDSQTSVEINVLNGYRPLAKDNKSLGRFHLDGIMPAPRGVPQIIVSFDINANGIMTVKAKDKATGKEQQIRIEGSSNLSKDEINKMKIEAEENAENDKKEKENIDVLNSAESLIFQTEKQIKEFEDKLDEESKMKLQDKLSVLKESVKSKNVDDIKSSKDELEKCWHEISQKMYEATQQDPVKDVNFEEVNQN
jgi:molecular chaperone DnaK